MSDEVLINQKDIMQAFHDTPQDMRSWSRAWWIINHFPKTDATSVVWCNDCKKHNIAIGDFIETKDGRRRVWKNETCPLVAYRGKALGHEYDYQYCVFGERKEE